MLTNAIFGLGGTELVIIMVVILLLFGGKKIPELMRGFGKGVRSFKDGLNEATKPENDDSAADAKGNDAEK